jgi:hypothetical protein
MTDVEAELDLPSLVPMNPANRRSHEDPLPAKSFGAARNVD